jgi:hypothetical protein
MPNLQTIIQLCRTMSFSRAQNNKQHEAANTEKQLSLTASCALGSYKQRHIVQRSRQKLP